MAGEDGLEWLFELDADISGPEKMLRVLDSLDSTLKKLDAGLGKTESASRMAGDAHRRQGKEAEHLGGIFKRLTDAALHPFLHKAKEIAEFEFVRRGVDALIELPGEMIAKVREIGEEMLLTAAKAERTGKAFNLLFGNEVGAETLEYIESIAKYTEFTDDHLKNSALSLAKVGFEGEGLTRALAASLDIAAFSGNAAEGQAEALASLERIKRTGRVDNRVLGGLGIGQKDFFAELAKRTGKGAATLKKEMDAGKIKAEDSLEALYSMISRKTGKDLGGAGVEMSTSLSAIFTHLQDLPDQYFQKLDKSSGFQNFKDQLGRLLEELDPDSPQGARLFAALEDAFDGIGAIIKTFDIAGVIELGISAVEDLERTFLAFMSLIPGATGTRAEGALRDMGARKEAREREAAIKSAFAARAEAMGTTPAFERAASLAKNAGKGFDAGIMSSVDAAKAASDKLADASLKQMADTLQIMSPSRVFKHMGKMVGEGYALGIESTKARNDNAVEETFGPSVAAPPPSAAAPPALSPRSQGGDLTVTVTVPVHVDGSGARGGAEIAEELAARLREILPGELAAAFSQLRLQAGG